MTKIVHNKLLGGWFVVRGPHQTPLCGRFDSKQEAEAWLKRKSTPMTREEKLKAIWRTTHRDYKGKLETGERAILVWREAHGTCLVPLACLTEAEIASNLKY